MLLLLMRPLLPLSSGTPPLIGKTPPLALEKGRPLIWVLAVIPLTTLAEGCDPPRISCIKKDNGGFGGAAFPVVALVAATGAGPLGNAATGPATGATSTGTASGAPASGSGGSSSASVGLLAVAGIWPLGKVFVGASTGATLGTIAGESSASGGSGMTGGCGSTSSRIRAELTCPRVMASSKRWMIVLESKNGVAAIFCEEIRFGRVLLLGKRADTLCVYIVSGVSNGKWG